MTSTVSGRGPLDVIEEKRFYEDFEKEVSPVIANFLKTHQLNSNVTIITRAEKKEK